MPGKVYLIGAGPGAADLITVRGAKLLTQAQVVLYDALITEELLALCPQAELIFVGKRAGQCSTPQISINEILLNCAKKYNFVVRLKGGDPMLFGRADEELSTLEANKIEFEIVPGITSALAAAAATQQPLTKRGVARSVAFFTSTNAPDTLEQVSIPNSDTLIQYMGGREAIKTAQRLLEHHYSLETPVIAIENCSRTNQKIFRMSLHQLAQGLNDLHGPVLIMIGEAMQGRANQKIIESTPS